MDTRQFETLIAVAETGSFAAAAARVNLTASAVSQQIQALEAQFGTPLFDRRTRPPRLNAKGEDLVRTARQIVGLLADTRSAITGGRTSGVLKIGAIRTASLLLLPLAVEAMRANYPDLTFSMAVGVSESLIADVAAQRLDAALVAENTGVPDGLTWTEVLSEPLVLVAPPGAPAESGSALLTALPFIRYDTAVPLARQIETELARLGARVRQIMVANSMPSVIGCVRAGMGCAVVPKLALLDLPEGALTVLPFGGQTITRQLGLVERQVSARSTVLAALRAAIVASAKSKRLPLPLGTEQTP